jgi:hypothetical protein
MSTRCFAITALIRFARTNRHVSGIQRVQIRVIRHLACQENGRDVLCLFAAGRFAPLLPGPRKPRERCRRPRRRCRSGASASSPPEVCGNLVDYVDPTNVEELAAAELALVNT